MAIAVFSRSGRGTLPKKGESLTTVCAAEAPPTYEKTGAGALVDIGRNNKARSRAAPRAVVASNRPLLDAVAELVVPLPEAVAAELEQAGIRGSDGQRYSPSLCTAEDLTYESGDGGYCAPHPPKVAGKGTHELLVAAHYGCLETVKALLAVGIDVNAVDGGFGWTPLIWAIRRGTLDSSPSERLRVEKIVAALLAVKGVDVNAANGEALSRAAQSGQAEVVRALLAVEGIDVNGRGGQIDGGKYQWGRAKSPLLLAFQTNCPQTIKALLAADGIDASERAHVEAGLSAATRADMKHLSSKEFVNVAEGDKVVTSRGPGTVLKRAGGRVRVEHESGATAWIEIKDIQSLVEPG